MASNQSGGSKQSEGSQHSQQGTKDSQSDSHKNQRSGSDNVANDPKKAGEAGGKDGQHSRGGSSK
jgi:general stress protein YciG